MTEENKEKMNKDVQMTSQPPKTGVLLNHLQRVNSPYLPWVSHLFLHNLNNLFLW